MFDKNHTSNISASVVEGVNKICNIVNSLVGFMKHDYQCLG